MTSEKEALMITAVNIYFATSRKALANSLYISSNGPNGDLFLAAPPAPVALAAQFAAEAHLNQV